MNDILGRELKDGDLCIGMAIGRNSSGMHIGILKGLSIVYLSHDEECICKTSPMNRYLIENPTEQELAIKEKVQKLLDEEENERKRKASLETIPLSKLEVGGVYQTANGLTYVYLGKRKVIFEDLWKRKKIEEKEGNCFASIWYVEGETPDKEILNTLLTIGTYRGNHNIDVLKGNKKLTRMIKKVNLEFPLVKQEKCNYRWSDEKYRLTIE